MERGLDQLSLHQAAIAPPLACGEDEGLRWAPLGPLEPFLLLTRGHVNQL